MGKLRMVPQTVRDAYRATKYEQGRGHWVNKNRACPLYVCIMMWHKLTSPPPNATLEDKEKLASLADEMCGETYRHGFEVGYNTRSPGKLHKPPRKEELGWTKGYLDGIRLRRHLWGE